MSEYLSAAETAKLVRAALKRSFPGVKFSVRSRTYSMGASIDVSWTDGPTSRLVQSVTDQFSGSRFDGMADMKVSRSHWLMPDGTASLAVDYGNGMEGQTRNEKPHPDAKLVHFGADSVSCSRDISRSLAERVLTRSRSRYAEIAEADVEIKDNWRSGVYFHSSSVDVCDRLWREAQRFMSIRAAV